MPNVDAGGTHNDLDGTLPELQQAEAQLYAYATGVLGIDYRIADFGAFRTEADTDLILKYRQDDYNAAVQADPSVARIPLQKFRRIAPYGSSMHNYGAAFDVLIINRGPYASSDAALLALKQAAPSFGLRSSVPDDPPHFELPMSVEDARLRWIDFSNGGGDDISVHFTGAADVASLATIAVIGLLVVAIRYFRR